MPTEIASRKLSAREQAEKEIREENREENVKQFKDKLTALKKAQKVVANLERDIEELEIELGDGE